MTNYLNQTPQQRADNTAALHTKESWTFYHKEFYLHIHNSEDRNLPTLIESFAMLHNLSDREMIYVLGANLAAAMDALYNADDIDF